jgi:hypothetical protein
VPAFLKAGTKYYHLEDKQMSEIGVIVGKLASYHEAYYRRYILFCPFHRVRLEPVTIYEDGHEKMSLFCMSSDVRLIKSYYDKPQVSVVASINSPRQLANIANYLLTVKGIEMQLDVIKITLNAERYRMEHKAETIIAENYFDEYDFIMQGYENKPVYTKYFNPNCLIDIYVNACLHKCLNMFQEEPNIVIKALHDVEFHPVEVVKLLQGMTTPREIIGGVR